MLSRSDLTRYDRDTHSLFGGKLLKHVNELQALLCRHGGGSGSGQQGAEFLKAKKPSSLPIRRRVTPQVSPRSQARSATPRTQGFRPPQVARECCHHRLASTAKPAERPAL